MPDHFKAIAVNACKLIKARNMGIDIIIGDLGDSNSARVLEANARHHIEGHSFCENKAVWDNSVAEAIVDLYFPNSASKKRFPGAIFDIAAVQRALAMQILQEVKLPTFRDNWNTRSFEFGRTEAHLAVRRSVVTESASLGVFVCEAGVTEASTLITFMGPEDVLERLVTKTGLLRTLALADEIEALNDTKAVEAEPKPT